jgi:hypothetical protein
MSSIHETPLVLMFCAIESSFSRTIVLALFLAAEYAADRPAGPPPTMTISYLSMYFPCCFDNYLLKIQIKIILISYISENNSSIKPFIAL